MPNSPEVSVMVCGVANAPVVLKVIVLPGQAVAIASRRLPAPLSAVLVTTGFVAQVMLMLRVDVTAQPVAVLSLNNLTSSWKLTLPGAVGVPVMAPVFASSDNPAGSVVLFARE